MSSTKPRSIFVSYSHDDAACLEPLGRALAPLVAEEQIDFWVDTRLQASQDWRTEIETALANAEMAILLLSQAFLASRFIREVELPLLMKAWEARDLPIFVVVASAFDEKAQPQILEIQAVNKPNQPLDRLTLGEQKQVWVDLATAIRGVQAQATRVSSSRGAKAHVPGTFLVPYRRNPYFSGRNEDLGALHTSLTKEGKAGIVEAVRGLGGVGKTQLALEYVYRHADEYRHTVWFQADDTATLDRDFGAAAKELGLATGGGNAEDVRRAMIDWLTRTPVYLAVFDNADDPSVLEPYLPMRMGGRVLVTSRAENLLKLGVRAPRNLASWTREQGSEFLLSRVGEELAKAGTGGTPASRAADLSEKLGGLPLALEQAAAYIVETGTSIPDYSREFDRQALALLEKHGPEFGPQRTVATTWSLNIDEIRQASPASIELLNVAAFLAPDRIPFEIFELGAMHFSGELASRLGTSAMAVGELLAPLRRYSLVTVDTPDHTFDVHRIVQAVVRAQLPQPRSEELRLALVNAVDSAFPHVEFQTWPACARLVSHTLAVSEGATETMILARLLNQIGYFYWTQGNYAQACPLYGRALAIREKALGPDHPDVATSLNNLAALLQDQGDLNAARPLHERALAVREKALGPDRPDVATSLNNLAALLKAQGDLNVARPLLERALAIREKALGPDHPDVATSLNNLAALLQDQGDLNAARPLVERALAISEKALGPDHPNVATRLNNLASLLHDQGDLNAARPLVERALEILRANLPHFHPNITTVSSNLASLYEELGRHGAAIALRQEAEAGKAEFRRRNPT